MKNREIYGQMLDNKDVCNPRIHSGTTATATACPRNPVIKQRGADTHCNLECGKIQKESTIGLGLVPSTLN